MHLYVHKIIRSAHEEALPGRASLSEATQARLATHGVLQDTLAGELVGLAQQLKQHAQGYEGALKARDRLVDDADALVAGNIERTSRAAAEASRVHRKYALFDRLRSIHDEPSTHQEPRQFLHHLPRAAAGGCRVCGHVHVYQGHELCRVFGRQDAREKGGVGGDAKAATTAAVGAPRIVTCS